MTEECNCLPLKQILRYPFKTSENTHFFQNFWVFSLGDLLASTGISGSPWVQECWAVRHCLPVHGNRWSLFSWGTVFPATSLFPPTSSSHQNWGMPCATRCSQVGCHPNKRGTSQACLPYTCALSLTGHWGCGVCPMLLWSQHSSQLSWVLGVGQHKVKCA